MQPLTIKFLFSNVDQVLVLTPKLDKMFLAVWTTNCLSITSVISVSNIRFF